MVPVETATCWKQYWPPTIFPFGDRVMWSYRQFSENVSPRPWGRSLGLTWKNVKSSGKQDCPEVGNTFFFLGLFISPTVLTVNEWSTLLALIYRSDRSKCQSDFREMNGVLQGSWPYRLWWSWHWKCKSAHTSTGSSPSLHVLSMETKSRTIPLPAKWEWDSFLID
jgi:hypothetical protein